MTVRKGEPMDHLAATDEEFDALLDASSLGAPHVVTETGDIPATARRRMAHAVSRPPMSFGMSDSPLLLQAADDEAGSRPAEPTETEVALQEVQPASRGIVCGVTSTGKSAILAALFTYRHSAYFGDSAVARHEPPARRSWTDLASADGLRAALWLADGSEEAIRAGRAQRGTPRGDGTLIFFRRQNTQPWPDMPISALRGPSGETQALSTSTAADSRAMQLPAPDIQMQTSPGLFAPAWHRAGRKQHGLRNLRHFIEPLVHPAHPLLGAMPSGLLLSLTPVERLHIARFTTCAYAAADARLLVPETAGVPPHRRRALDISRAGCDLRPAVGARGVTLWQTRVDGMDELSAELPMLLHLEERESLAHASSLHARLTYRVSDPYAVEARFRADDHGETVWIFARELLRDGLESTSGLGDVTVWPGTGTRGRPRIFVRLSSPEGSALLSAEDADVRAFLEAGSNLVSYGEEHEHLLPALNALETTIGQLARPGRRD
ncbi:SsgA family sporulation/cell division regulator [Streptomyces bobili]